MDPVDLAASLRRGTLEFCVLALLRRGPRYSVELVSQLAEIDGLAVSEGTMYPLLRRLRTGGQLASTWQESPAGPPRRYYTITAKGERDLAVFVKEWIRYRDAVDHALTLGDIA